MDASSASGSVSGRKIQDGCEKLLGSFLRIRFKWCEISVVITASSLTNSMGEMNASPRLELGYSRHKHASSSVKNSGRTFELRAGRWCVLAADSILCAGGQIITLELVTP